jgi:hypothetical protein
MRHVEFYVVRVLCCAWNVWPEMWVWAILVRWAGPGDMPGITTELETALLSMARLHRGS